MKTIKITGFYDTGNCLYEPIRGRPVAIIGKNTACRLFEGEEWRTRFCLIPYNSIGMTGGVMKGFFVDEIIIFVNRYAYVYMHPVLAVAEQPFGRKRGYEIILHSDMI